MRPESPVLSGYQTLAKLTDAMLECAEQERWDDLTALEAERFTLVESLRRMPGLAEQPREVSEPCEALINRILSQQGEISRRVEAWRGELGELLNSFETGRKLKRTYLSQ